MTFVDKVKSFFGGKKEAPVKSVKDKFQEQIGNIRAALVSIEAQRVQLSHSLVTLDAKIQDADHTMKKWLMIGHFCAANGEKEDSAVAKANLSNAAEQKQKYELLHKQTSEAIVEMTRKLSELNADFTCLDITGQQANAEKEAAELYVRICDSMAEPRELLKKMQEEASMAAGAARVAKDLQN